jgi:hypothetical protein
MLEAQGRFNQISPQLRKELEDKAQKLGRHVKYKFAIARMNPDGEQRADGPTLYPFLFSVTPVTFQIKDPHDGKIKYIGLPIGLKELGAREDSFRRINIKKDQRGVLALDMNKPDDQDVYAFLELHPKNENGKFRDNEMPAIISLIDDVLVAQASITKRNLRIDAMFVANNFSAKEIRDFAAAMGWYEHDDASVLKDRIVDLADKNPEFFKEFVDNKSIQYRAVLQRALDNRVIAYIPVESKIVWASNRQTIAVLERVEDNNLLDRLCDWVLNSKNGMEVYKKIQSLSTEKAAAKQ